MVMLNNQRVPAPLYPGRWDLAQRAALRMMWRSSPMWVGREPRAELHALSCFSQVSTRTAFSFRVVDFPGEEYKKRLPGKQYQYFQIPDGNNISWYPSLVKHFVSCFTCCDPPGFRPSSTQEDAMDFNLNCRRRLNCGAPWAFWWFQHVSACCSSKHVLCMSFPETKVNQALQVFRNIDPPIEGQEVGISEFGNGDICGNWWDRKTKKTPKSRTYSMTWISKQVILVIVFKFLAAARGLVQAGDCAVYLWATKGSNLVYKLGVGTRCGFCQISQQGFVNATFAVEKFVTVAHFLWAMTFCLKASAVISLFAALIQEGSQPRVSQVVQVVSENQNESTWNNQYRNILNDH